MAATILTALTLGIYQPAQAFEISSSSAPALSGANVIDFTGVPTGSYSTDTFGNVTISATSGTYTISNQFAGSYNTTGENLQANQSSSESLRFDFASPVSAFGFNFGASDYTWNLQAYNASGAPLESYGISATKSVNNGAFFGLADPSISYATLTNTNSGLDLVTLDNFSSVTAPGNGGSGPVIPEPGSLWLFASGLLGIAGLKRWRIA